jgi:hypothetical protein
MIADIRERRQHPLSPPKIGTVNADDPISLCLTRIHGDWKLRSRASSPARFVWHFANKAM